jgi:malonate-semialdehyde dehydrogenase (acetylating)/methylmalonate-semialdehyde dehydrogenase
MRLIDHLVAGSAGVSARRAGVFNPSTGAVQAEVALGDAALLDRAVAAAQAAQAPGPLPTPAPRARDV